MRELIKDFRRIDIMSGVGNIGFLSAEPALSPEARMAAMAVGINYLRARFIVAPTMEAALEHDREIRDPGLKHFYLIGDPVAPNIREHQKNGVYYREDQNWVRMDEALAAERFPSEKFTATDFGPQGLGYQVPGWLFSKKYRAVLKAENVPSSRKVRRLLKQGYTVTFNSAFDRVLEGIALKTRKGGAKSRYTEHIQQVMRDLFLHGYTYSIEVWNPRGELVAGEVGYRYGGLFKGDSQFWMDPDLQDPAILGTMMVSALAARLKLDGIHLSDGGSYITGSAKQAGTTYMTGPEFLTHVDRLTAMPAPQMQGAFMNWDQYDIIKDGERNRSIAEAREARKQARRDEIKRNTKPKEPPSGDPKP